MTAKRGNISMATHVPHRKAQYAGIVLGIGLGGFVDGIVLHQIVQWHHMLSNWMPPTTLETMHVNMVWDGLFHAGVWLDVCFINSSPVELPYACTVEGDRRQVQNVGAGG